MVVVKEMLIAIAQLVNVPLVVVLIREWFTLTVCAICAHAVTLACSVEINVLLVVTALMGLYWMKQKGNVSH